MRMPPLSYLLFPVFPLVVLCGCRKQDKVATIPPAPVVTQPEISNLPTKNLDGKYIWHSKGYRSVNGKDTLVEIFFTDGISAGDSTISIHSDRFTATLSGGAPVSYKYAFSNDTEIVYKSKYNSITYRFNRNLVIWSIGSSIWYGVPGQTTKWANLYDGKLTEERVWRRTLTYYDMAAHVDTFVTLPEITGSAFQFFEYVTGRSKKEWLLDGADSTMVIYQNLYYDYGPSSSSVIGDIIYFASNDSISIKYRTPGLHGSIYTFDTP